MFHDEPRCVYLITSLYENFKWLDNVRWMGLKWIVLLIGIPNIWLVCGLVWWESKSKHHKDQTSCLNIREFVLNVGNYFTLNSGDDREDMCIQIIPKSMRDSKWLFIAGVFCFVLFCFVSNETFEFLRRRCKLCQNWWISFCMERSKFHWIWIEPRPCGYFQSHPAPRVPLDLSWPSCNTRQCVR